MTVKYRKYGKIQTKKLLYMVKVVEKDFPVVTDDSDLEEDENEVPEEKNEYDTIAANVSQKHIAPPVKITPKGTPYVYIKTPKPTSAQIEKPTQNVLNPIVTPVSQNEKKDPSITVVKPVFTTKPIATPVAPKKETKPSYVTLPDGIYKIGSKVKSGMMLDVSGGASKNGTNIQIYNNNESAAQRFIITHINSGWYKICSQSSGKALDVTGAAKKSGVNVQIYDYNGTAAQLWRFISTDQGYYNVQNKLGYYLDVEGGKTSNDTNVQVYSKNDTNSQKWKLGKIVYPQKINLNTSSFTLTSIGAAQKIAASFVPADTTQKSVTWTTSDNKIVTVSNGTVEAVGSGTATITAKTSNGKTASVKVTVNDGCVNVKNGLYSINTKISSGFTLDVKGNGTTNGTDVQIYKNNGSVAQKFQVESVGNGWYVISNAYPKMCLDVQGGSGKSGTNVNLYHYNGTDAQKWRFYSAGNGYYSIMNKCGNYLDVSGGAAKNDTNVQVYEKNGTDAQKWKLVKTESQYVNIANSLYSLYSKVGNNFVLDISGAGTADGTNIQIYQGNDSIAQKFKIQAAADGWYIISNPLSGKCLDVQGGVAKSGVNVQLHTFNGTDAQKWRFCTAGDGDYFVIKNKLGFYLDVDGAKAQNGTNVLVFTKNGSNAQKWRLRETSTIIVNPSTFTLDGIGKTKNLSVSYEPDHTFAANKTIQWSSSNTKVATVSNGTVKAVGAGTATITAKTYNGKTYSVIVTVKAGTWSVSNSILKVNGVSMIEYKVGSKYTQSRYANVNGKSVDMCGWQCCGYARYIQQKLYGCHEFNAGVRFKAVCGVVSSGSLNASRIQSIVNAAGVGAHIRTNKFNGTNQHSMIIIGITSNGFTIADANSDGKYTVRVKTFTWSEYVNAYGRRGLEYVNRFVG